MYLKLAFRHVCISNFLRLGGRVCCYLFIVYSSVSIAFRDNIEIPEGAALEIAVVEMHTKDPLGLC